MVASGIAYIVPLLIALMGAGLYDFGIYRNGKHFLWSLLCGYLILVLGLRYEVGGDTLNYMGWFEWAKDLKDWSPFNMSQVYEPGFTLLAALAKSCGDEFYYLQFLHAGILNICIFYFISTNTRYWFSSLLIAFLTYYIYFSTEVLREAIAVMIFVLNFKLFMRKEWGKYYIMVIICILFHYSASFLLFLPFFSRLRFSSKFIWFVMFFGLMCFGLRSMFFAAMEHIPLIGDKAIAYAGHSFVGYFWAGLRVFQFSIIPVLLLKFAHNILHQRPKYEITYLFIIMSGIGVIFLPIIFQRFTNYFYPLYALSITDILCNSLRSRKFNIKFSGVLLSLIITFGYGTYFIYLDAYQMWLPYSSIMNPIHYQFRNKFANGGNG